MEWFWFLDCFPCLAQPRLPASVSLSQTISACVKLAQTVCPEGHLLGFIIVFTLPCLDYLSLIPIALH